MAATRVDHVIHRDVRSGGLRAAIFGFLDGLVTNTALIVGVASASGASGSFVRAAGFAGLFAGAFSMAAGEYASMRGQKELLERELRLEAEELVAHPEGERRELIALLRERGISEATATQVAQELMSDRERALEAHAREELGIDPRQLGSPVQAALSSLLAFAAGALIPLVPWLAGGGTFMVALSVALAVLAAAGGGVLLSRLAALSPWKVALRQVLLGAVAVAVTAGVEHLFHVNPG
jgi:VIT1/CCC1 family predicted Fe2+/Mn2+ transporter